MRASKKTFALSFDSPPLAPSRSKIGVVVINQHALFRKALAALLGDCPDIHVLLETDDAISNIDMVRSTGAAVLVFVVTDSSRDLQTLSTIHTLLPDAKILIVVDDGEDEFVLGAIKAGIYGHVSPCTDPDGLYQAVEAVARGRIVLDQRVFSRIVQRKRGSDHRVGKQQLTSREKRVLALLAAGRRNKEIGAQLFMSDSTVKTHVSHIFEKLGASSRVDAARLYYGLSQGEESTSPSTHREMMSSGGRFIEFVHPSDEEGTRNRKYSAPQKV